MPEDVVQQLADMVAAATLEQPAAEADQNWQEQSDEMEALQSIYGDDLQLINGSGCDWPAFSIDVQVEILQPLQVAARLPADTEVNSDQEQGASAGAASRGAPPGAPLANGKDGKEDSARERANRGHGAQLPSEGNPPAASNGGEEDHPGQVASAPAATSADGPRDEDRPSSSYSASTSADGRHQYVTMFAVEFLPPLRLTCVLPPSYPSRAPPSFRLSCQWLGERHLAALCGEMDALWAQQAGQVVVYQWADHLSRCLQSLGLTEQLELGPYGPSRAGARRPGEGRAAGEGAGGALPLPRAVSESVSLEEDVMQLRRFDEEQRAAAFRGGIHTCAICFTEQPGVDFVRLPCGHHFCRDCMRTFAASHVAEGTVASITCPDVSCRGGLHPGLLRELLAADEFGRWEQLTLQRTLNAMADLTYCPRCSAPCLEDPGDSHAQCAQCFFSFCGLCHAAWHTGQACMSPEAKLRVLQERMKGGAAAGSEQARRESDLINEMKNLTYVSREAKRCPKCGMAISKVEGCNKMTCGSCYAYFCYRCGKEIKGYDHFGSERCVLFDQDAINAWEQQIRRPDMAVAGRIAQVAGEQWPDLRRNCPTCHQQCVKLGNNNHIACWACKNHFCAACGRTVRSSAEHYGGPNKCRQHSR